MDVTSGPRTNQELHRTEKDLLTTGTGNMQQLLYLELASSLPILSQTLPLVKRQVLIQLIHLTHLPPKIKLITTIGMPVPIIFKVPMLAIRIIIKWPEQQSGHSSRLSL